MKKVIAEIKEHSLLYFCLALLFVSSNLLFDKEMFTGDVGDWFAVKDVYIIMAVLVLAVMLVCLWFAGPFYLCAENGPSIQRRIFRLWLPFGIYIILQTLIFVVSTFIFTDFDISVFTLVTYAIVGLVSTFIWTILVSAIYFASPSASWYFFGIVSVFVSSACMLHFFNVFVGLPAWSVLWTIIVPVMFPLLCTANPIAFILYSSVYIVAFALLMWLYNKGAIKLSGKYIQMIFKVATSVLMSLTVGVFFIETEIFLPLYVIITAFALAISISCIFGNYKVIKISIITALSVGIVAVIVLGVLKKQKETLPPDSKNIDYVIINLNSYENYRLDYSFSSCVDLHKKLIALTKEDYDREALESPPVV